MKENTRMIRNWLLGTLSLMLTVSILQTYERSITLDSVRALDFEIIHKIVDSFDSVKDHEKSILAGLNVLTSSSGRVRFPVSIILKDECFENGVKNHSKSICSQYPNMAAFSSLIDTSHVREYYSYHILIDNGRNLFFTSLKNGGYLIGRAGRYFTSSRIDRVSNFIRTDLLHSFTTKHGLYKMYYKSKYIWLIIFMSSFILLLLFIFQKKKAFKKYNNLQKEKNTLNEQWEKLNDEYRVSVQEIKVKEDELLQKEKELVDSENTLKVYAPIENLKQEIETLKYDKALKLKAIKKLEDKENKLLKNANLQIVKLSNEKKEEIHNERNDELHSIKQLWRREPDWSDRRAIEKKVTKEIIGRPGLNIPFTATQAFIAFEENIVREQVRSHPDFKADNTLGENVHLLIKNKMIDWNMEKVYRDITNARNDWFHYGHLPSASVMYRLLDILQENNSEPLL